MDSYANDHSFLKTISLVMVNLQLLLTDSIFAKHQKNIEHLWKYNSAQSILLSSYYLSFACLLPDSPNTFDSLCQVQAV